MPRCPATAAATAPIIPAPTAAASSLVEGPASAPDPLSFAEGLSASVTAKIAAEFHAKVKDTEINVSQQIAGVKQTAQTCCLSGHDFVLLATRKDTRLRTPRRETRSASRAPPASFCESIPQPSTGDGT